MVDVKFPAKFDIGKFDQSQFDVSDYSLDADDGDSFSLSDAIDVSRVPRTFDEEHADSVSLSETIQTEKISSLDLDETLSLSDTADVQLITAEELDDTVSLVDTAQAEKVPATYEKTASDTISLADTSETTFTLNISGSDTLSLTDTSSIGIIYGVNASDTLTLADSAQAEIFIKQWDTEDIVGLSDSVLAEKVPNTYDRIVSDTMTLQDDIIVLGERDVSDDDAISLSDAVSIGRIAYATETDSVTLSDDISTEQYGMGLPGRNRVWINDNGTWRLFDFYVSFKVLKRQNQPSEFEMTIFDIDSGIKDYFKEQSEMLFFAGETMILKGRIQTIEYGSGYTCTARGFGMESVLLDKEFVKAGDKRVDYTNYSAQTMSNELLLSDPDDTSSSKLLTPDTGGIFGADYGDLTMRFEYANRLNALGSVAKAIDYEWWVSQSDGDQYNEDTFHMATLRGGTTSEQTFVISGTGTNAVRTSNEKDITNMANYVSVLGYGDGENQLGTYVYAASTQSSTLSADITSSASATVSLLDASSFPNTGTGRIAKEQFTWAGKSGNNLTGCDRGVNSTTPRTHKKGVYTEVHYDTLTPQTGSSIQTYGIMDTTQVDRTLIDEDTAELVASKFLIDHYDPVQRIKIIPTEPLTDAQNLEVGDLITVTDSESGIDDDYRIVGIEYRDEYGYLTMEIEVSNVTLEFIEQMQKEKQENRDLQKYMQGSTNIYSVNQAENADDSTPLNMRFYLPEDAVAINKVKLNFKLEDFRAYSSTTDSNEVTTTVGSDSVGGSAVTLNDTNWHSGANLTVGATATDGIQLWGSYNEDGITIADGNFATDEEIIMRIYDGSSYYPNSGGVDVMDGYPLFSKPPGNGGNFSIYIPGDHSNKTFTVQVKRNGGEATHSGYTALSYLTVSKHTHGIGYQISEESLVSPSVDLSVGLEGSETVIGTYTADQTNLDITDAVTDVGAGNWINLKFEPNKRMRIEADAYVRLFIDSES